MTIYVFIFYNPYTGKTAEIFAPDYETAVIELEDIVDYSWGYQYKGMREMIDQDLEDLNE